MDIIFISDSHWLILKLSDKINLKTSYKYVAFSAPSWNDKFELPDGSYSVSDFQDYFEFIIKKHETLTNNFQVRIDCISTKLKTESHLNSNQDIIWNSWHLKQWNYLGALKIK